MIRRTFKSFCELLLNDFVHTLSDVIQEMRADLNWGSALSSNWGIRFGSFTIKRNIGVKTCCSVMQRSVSMTKTRKVYQLIAAAALCCIGLFTTCKNNIGLGSTIDINAPTIKSI